MHRLETESVFSRLDFSEEKTSNNSRCLSCFRLSLPTQSQQRYACLENIIWNSRTVNHTNPRKFLGCITCCFALSLGLFSHEVRSSTFTLLLLPHPQIPTYSCFFKMFMPFIHWPATHRRPAQLFGRNINEHNLQRLGERLTFARQHWSTASFD